MDTNKVLKFGIVGCGYIADIHARAAQNVPDMRFASCCDINRELAEKWSASHGCDRFYSDYNEMIQKEQMDVLLLATPPADHFEQVKAAIAVGIKNILCEKAFVLCGKDALELKRLADEKGVFIMEGFAYRQHPVIKKLAELAASGENGTVDSVRGVFNNFEPETTAEDDPKRSWRLRKECGGGIVYDYTCYPVNACNHFSGGRPVRAFAVGNIGRYGTVNRLYGMIEYGNGCLGIIESSRKAVYNEELQISCTKGLLNLPVAWTIFDDTISIKQTNSLGQWAKVASKSYDIQNVNVYALELQNFVDVMKGVAKPEVPLAESVIAAYTIEALVTSMMEKRAVDIKLPAGL